MVDTSAGQKVTVKCHGSGKEGIRYHQPMMGVKEYSDTMLELTAENFQPGIYRCRCASSIQGQLNISLPLAVTGEGWGQLQVHARRSVKVYTDEYPGTPMCLLHYQTVCTAIAFSEVTPVQWNLSIKDTTGTQLAVLYREVSLIQR